MQNNQHTNKKRNEQQNFETENLKYRDTNKSLDGFKQGSIYENQNRSIREYQQSRSPRSPKDQHSEKQNETKQKISHLLKQNKKLRISNKQLKKQLQIFQKRLDQTLKKRTVSQKKPRVNRETVQNMQLKNAYKQCEIYKRQITNLKKKQALFDQNKLNELNNQLSQMQIERQKLLQQIKGLKRISKVQQKSLIELTDSNFTKILKQYSQLKQQNRKLSQKLAKQDREAAYSRMSMHNQKRKNKQAEVKASQSKKKQQQKQNTQLQILKVKTDKDSKRIMFLTNQNNKLTSYNEEIKKQLQQKDKQINTLKLRLNALRKQVRVKRIQTQPTEQHQEGRSTRRRPESKKHGRQKTETSELFQTQISNGDDGKRSYGKYPKLVEAGDKKQSSFKWNHHQYSSKIKQVQVSNHPNGHIAQINFRYEKGQPNANINSKNLNKFICQQNTGQYVRKVKGGFKDGLLSYLILQTNKGRISNFGQTQKEYLCNNFVFGQLESQFPGAFFGETSTQGINRIGCLIQCLK